MLYYLKLLTLIVEVYLTISLDRYFKQVCTHATYKAWQYLRHFLF